MAENKYPFLQLQIDQHRRFSSSLESFKDEIKQNLKQRQIFLLIRTPIFVMDWLVNHTSKLGRHWGRFLSRRGDIG